MDRRDIDAELERVTADFHRLLDDATGAELGMPTNGTKWTNKQLLFHMLFGFIVVRALLPLVKGFGRLPPTASRTFAAILNAGTRPFHVVNYLSALPGGTALGSRALGRLMDSTIEHLRRRLARESERTLGLARPPASSAAVMNAWRRVWGPTRLAISARRATRRTIRPAA